MVCSSKMAALVLVVMACLGSVVQGVRPGKNQALATACTAQLFNPTFVKTSVTTATVAGDFILTGFVDCATVPANGWPVVILYHGGGGNAKTFLSYTGLARLHAVVIALEGQPAYNSKAWLNAFPWLKNPPRNDVALTEAAIAEAKKNFHIDPSRIFATGKSDGGGMAVFLAAHPELRSFDLAGAAPVSGAYFGANNRAGFSPFTFPVTAKDYTTFTLASRAVPMLVMHGTADSVMPFKGAHFSSNKAVSAFDTSGAFWGKASGFTSLDNAWTAPIESYWGEWASSVNGVNSYVSWDLSRSPTRKARCVQHSACGKLPLTLIVLEGADHSWFGHKDSGPGASTEAGLQLDATFIIAAFFDIPLSAKYANTTDVKPDAPSNVLRGTTHRTRGSC